jgi:hypothetical protein
MSQQSKDDPLYVSCDGVSVCGLTTRELFAAMAMQGLLTFAGTDNANGPELAAMHAVRQADALIAELNKPKT